MKCKIFVLVICALMFSSAGPIDVCGAETLSVRECIEKVHKYYPVLKRQNARVDLAVMEKMQAFSSLLPFIRGAGSVTTSDDPVFVFSSLLKEGAFTESNFEVDRLNHPRHKTNFNFALQGELPLFNAFQTIDRIKSAELKVKSVQDESRFVDMEASLIAVEAYLNVILYEKFYELVSEMKVKSEDDIKQAKDLKDRGVILGADYYAAKVILGGITQLKNRFYAQGIIARAALNILMGENPAKEYQLTGDFSSNVRPSGDLQEWVKLSFKSRPDLLAVQNAVKMGEIDLRREKNSILPRVNAFGSIEENTGNMRSGLGNFMMGFKGTMDIFDPSYFPRIKKAEERLTALKEDEKILKDTITRSVTREYESYKAICANLPVVAEILSDAGQAVTLTEPLYQEGRKSIADLLEMRKAFLDNSTARNEMIFSSETQYAQILFLCGALDENSLSEIAGRLEGEK